jgi:riboflavin synthase
MFTGIVEEVGEVVQTVPSGGNLDLLVRAAMAGELAIDQSVAHNGVCLTVVDLPSTAYPGCYRVTAVEETLRRTGLGLLKPGDGVNLERSLRLNDRVDGHLVQGHVDTLVTCTDRHDRNGSWEFRFELPKEDRFLVEKGSICLNGVSLTIASLRTDGFSVAVIPYTMQHSTFRSLEPGGQVNVEFDVLGKYVARMLADRATA